MPAPGPGAIAHERQDWKHVAAAERISLAHKLLVIHPRFREAVALLQRCHQSGQIAGEPVCGALMGASGVGKTSVVDHYCKLHPAIETETATRQSVLKVT